MTTTSSCPGRGRSNSKIDARPLVFWALLATGLCRGAAWAQVTKLSGHLETSDSCQIARIQLAVDNGGTCLTSDTGSFVCDAPGQPGEDVRLLMPNHPKCLVFYPPNGRTTLRRPEVRESITVTLVEKDSPKWKSTDELRRLIRGSTIQQDTKSFTPQQLDSRLREWAEFVKEQTGEDNEAFIKLMVKKQGQIQDYTKVSTLLMKFLNRGEEIVAAFQRHAPGAVGYIEAQIQLSKTVTEYTEVYHEIKESGDAYQASIETYWGRSMANEYGSLLDNALEIHDNGIYKLSDVLTLINKLNFNQIKVPAERQAAKTAIRDLTATLTQKVDTDLKELRKKVELYSTALKADLAVF